MTFMLFTALRSRSSVRSQAFNKDQICVGDFFANAACVGVCIAFVKRPGRVQRLELDSNDEPLLIALTRFRRRIPDQHLAVVGFDRRARERLELFECVFVVNSNSSNQIAFGHFPFLKLLVVIAS